MLHKKILSLILMLAITISMAIPVPSYAANENVKDSQTVKDSQVVKDSNADVPQQAKFETVLSINIGNGENEVGYSNSGEANDGPSSFAVQDNGRILILDTLNKKVLIYNNYSWSKNIDLPFCQYPRDITSNNGKIYILDETNIIYQINENGLIENTINLPNNLESYQVQKISVNGNGDIEIDTIDNKAYRISSDGTQNKISQSLVVNKQSKSATIAKNGKLLSSIKYADGSGNTDIINDDSKGNTFVNVEEYVPNSSYVLLESTLRKIDQNGNQVAVARIPLENYYNYPLRFFNVTDSGNIYIMALKKDDVEIQKVILGEKYQSQMSNLKTKAKQENGKLAATSKLKANSIWRSRATVKDRADTLIDYTWTYKSANAQAPSAVTKPSYLAKSSVPSQQTGIPYCWGGFDAADSSSSSANGKYFSQAMANGKFAGNINCVGGWKAGTAGLDCSGFVSASYGLGSKYSTSGLASQGRAVSTPSSMDMYVNAGSHVVLYAGDASTSTIYTKEATTSGTEKAKNYSRTKAYLSTNHYVLRTMW